MALQPEGNLEPMSDSEDKVEGLMDPGDTTKSLIDPGDTVKALIDPESRMKALKDARNARKRKKGGDQKGHRIGGGERKPKISPSVVNPSRGGYARVPSRGTISTSTTCTSLATECEGQLPRNLSSVDSEANYVFEDDNLEHQLIEEEEEEDNNFEQVRLHFQNLKNISLNSNSKYKMEMEVKSGGAIKDENLRTVIPFVRQLSTDNGKMGKDEYSINGDGSPYKPTTKKFYIITQFLAAIAVSLGSLMVGFTTAYTSPALVTMQHVNSTIQVSEAEGSWVGGLMPLAALVGGIVGGPLIEHLGRRNTILATGIPFIISWILIATAPNVYMVYAGRSIGGLCVGVGSLSFPVYLGETIQPEVRGQLGLFPTAFGNIGILICFIAGMALNWSHLAYLGAIIPIPFMLMTFLVPETPRWYVSRGDTVKAREAIEWLRGKDGDIDQELQEIMDSHLDSQKGDEGSAIKELFNFQHRRAVLTSLGLMLFQQLSGINAVIFYTVSIFRDAGSSIDENLSTIIVGIVNFVATFIATLLIERLGRKILLYISSVAMIITSISLGTYFFVKYLEWDVQAYGWIPLVSFVIYVTGFSLGFGPIPWLMMGEILPGKIRGTAASLATAFNWFCTFVVTKSFANVRDLIGAHGVFWLFGFVCICGLIFTIFFVPETKGKSLEDIEKKLAGKPKESAVMSSKLSIGC